MHTPETETLKTIFIQISEKQTHKMSTTVSNYSGNILQCKTKIPNADSISVIRLCFNILDCLLFSNHIP